MKILYVTTIGGTMAFFKTFVPDLIKQGHQVDVAANFVGSEVPQEIKDAGCKLFQIDWSRSPLDKNNFKAIRQLKTVVMQQAYDIVHCHTPIAAACTRIACRKARKKFGTKVIYTAHGFHFFTGAPMKNWLIFYTIEKFCARMTDVLITINREDFERAKKKLKVRNVEYVPGVGIHTNDFKPSAENELIRTRIREELQIPVEALLLLSVGELNDNKNHETVIQAVAELSADDSVYYMIAGQGGKKEYLQDLVKTLNLGERVRLLGYRTDVKNLYKASDVFVHPSFREGLPVSVMEAMASGLPIIGSNIRGNRDLIVDGKGGYLCSPHSVSEFADKLSCILKDKEEMGTFNIEQAKKYAVNEIDEMVLNIYEKSMK